MRLLKQDAIVLGVDFQEHLVPILADKELFIANSARFLKGVGLLGLPILVSEQYPKGLGPTVAPIKEAAGDAHYLSKRSFSCCDEPAIVSALEQSGKKTVVLLGCETHICVMQTAVDLKAAGYDVAVVADCCASRFPQNRDLGLQRMEKEGVIVTGSESLLFELLRDSRAPEFKAVQALVK
jgi:hypothetical protein